MNSQQETHTVFDEHRGLHTTQAATMVSTEGEPWDGCDYGTYHAMDVADNICSVNESRLGDWRVTFPSNFVKQ